VNLFDVDFPDGLFQSIPLRLHIPMEVFHVVALESTGAGHPMKTIAGVEIKANQIAQQAHNGPSDRKLIHTGTYLKKRILVQNQGGRKVQPGGILEYFEDLNRAPNAEFGPKDFFEMCSNMCIM
jgi:hypothetical protein